MRIRSSGSAGTDEAEGQPGGSRQQQPEGGSGGHPDHCGGANNSDLLTSVVFEAFSMACSKTERPSRSFFFSRNCVRGV